MKKTKWIHEDDLYYRLQKEIGQLVRLHVPLDSEKCNKLTLFYTEKIIKKLYKDNNNDNNGWYSQP